MSKSKHTPGPYTVQAPGLNGGNYCILAPEKENGWSSVVALLTPRVDMPVEANAALLAAAPEMFEVLKVIQADPVGCFDDSEFCKRIDAAIAKAKGRACDHENTIDDESDLIICPDCREHASRVKCKDCGEEFGSSCCG